MKLDKLKFTRYITTVNYSDVMILEKSAGARPYACTNKCETIHGIHYLKKQQQQNKTKQKQKQKKYSSLGLTGQKSCIFGEIIDKIF